MVGAIVLAGGRGARLGGVDKASLRLDGVTLLQRTLAALGSAGPVVVVGPGSLAGQGRFTRVREAPPFAGPAAAIVAGLAALGPADEVLLLAVDVPGVAAVVSALLDADPGDADGVVAAGPDGRPQWLLGRYRTAALRRAAERLADPAGRSVRDLLGGLTLVTTPVPDVADVDTVADARRAGVALPGGSEMTEDDVEAALAAWWAKLQQALQLDEVPVGAGPILGLAGEAAHGVVRPAAPVTTFLAGYAAGRAGGSAADVADAIARARAAIRE